MFHSVKAEFVKFKTPTVWEYINPDQEKSNSLCCSIVNRLIQRCYDWAKVKWTRDLGSRPLRTISDRCWTELQSARCEGVWAWTSILETISCLSYFMTLCLTLYWSWLMVTQQREYQQFLPLFDISSGFSFHSLFISPCHILIFKKKTHTSLKPKLLKKKRALLFIYGGKTKGSKNTVERKQPFSVWFVIGQ